MLFFNIFKFLNIFKNYKNLCRKRPQPKQITTMQRRHVMIFRNYGALLPTGIWFFVELKIKEKTFIQSCPDL